MRCVLPNSSEHIDMNILLQRIQSKNNQSGSFHFFPIGYGDFHLKLIVVNNYFLLQCKNAYSPIFTGLIAEILRSPKKLKYFTHNYWLEVHNLSHPHFVSSVLQGLELNPLLVVIITLPVEYDFALLYQQCPGFHLFPSIILSYIMTIY